jgi:hypothetical protein
MPCTARPAIRTPGDAAAPQSAERGRGREHDYSRQKDAFPAVLIAERSADENQRAEEQGVGFDDPLHVGHRRLQPGL